jgi:hypothetical protein
MERVFGIAIETIPSRQRRNSFYTNQPFSRLKLESAIRAEWADLGLDVGGKERDLPELATQAGEGNRTLVSSLEGYSFTIKLHPR